MRKNTQYSLAAIEVSADQSNDLLLTQVADQLIKDGVRIAGVVQSSRPQGADCRCAMDLKILPAGPIIPISQNLGAHAAGCRLDTGQLENAVATVERTLDDHTDILILNKFGNREAHGKGFAPLIAEALYAGVPVLIGMSRLNIGAIEQFCDGQFIQLVASQAAVLEWCNSVRHQVT